MVSLALKGGHLITPLEDRFATLWIHQNTIFAVGGVPPEDEHNYTTLDVSGCFVTPGLFDLQVNGTGLCDLWAEPTEGQLRGMQAELAQSGVTAFLPTLITADIAHLRRNSAFLEEMGAGEPEPQAVSESETGSVAGARMAGIHLEGPCLSPEKPGVHPPQWLRPLTSDVLEQIARGAVRLVTVAPELDPQGRALDWLRQRGVHASLGHSNATFEEAMAAFDRGVRLVTHIFNALPALHHRAPGAVGAALLDERVSCCVIADGLHVDPDMVKLLVRTKGQEKTILVSDAAHVGTSRGGLVGSSIKLTEAVRNMVGWKAATFHDAIRMATWNPSRAVGLDDRLGHLAPGKLADVVVWEKESLRIRHVIVGGKLVETASTPAA